MKCRSPPRVHVESSDSAGGGAACSCATVALWETLWKSKEQPESSLALGSPGAECQWWPRGMSKDRNPMVCLKFLHLSCSSFAGSQGQWGARNFRPSEAEILLQPQESPADLQPLSASPAGAAQEGSPANWWVLHMCCCLWHVCKRCILTKLTAMSLSFLGFSLTSR